MDEATAAEVVDILQDRLYALIDLHLTLKHIHWNVVGPNFIGVHEMLDPQVDAVRGLADEHRRAHRHPRRLADRHARRPGRAPHLGRLRPRPGPTQAHLGALDLVYRGVIGSHREAIEALDELDPVTQDMLIGQTEQLEQFHWFVRAHLEDKRRQPVDRRREHRGRGRRGRRWHERGRRPRRRARGHLRGLTPSTVGRVSAPHDVPALDRAGLEALQLERLRSTLRTVAERVPHHRGAFAASGVGPEDLHELADLARFPFTTKDDLRRAYPFDMLAVPREQLARVHASSGTTGQATVVGHTAEDIATWASLVARSMRAAGERARATWCTWPTATACSPAASAPTTARRRWAAPSSRSAAA